MSFRTRERRDGSKYRYPLSSEPHEYTAGIPLEIHRKLRGGQSYKNDGTSYPRNATLDIGNRYQALYHSIPVKVIILGMDEAGYVWDMDSLSLEKLSEEFGFDEGKLGLAQSGHIRPDSVEFRYDKLILNEEID